MIIATMVTYEQIIEAVDEIARRFKPQRVILFGSYAYGEPDEGSDVDVMVVMNHRMPSHRKASSIRNRLDVRFPMDILVRSDRDIRERIAMRDYFLMDVIEKGIALYDGNDPRVGRQGRGRLRRHLNTAPVA